MVLSRALNCGTEVSGPSIGLIVRCSVHESLLTVASAERVQLLIILWNSLDRIEPFWIKDIKSFTQWKRMDLTSHLAFSYRKHL